MARVQFGTAKGVKGDQGPIGPTGATGPQGYPGVTDIATASAVGLVRASDDVEVNAETGAMNIKNTVTEAASVTNVATGDSHQTILGKIAAAISKLITIAGDYLKSSNIVNQASTSTTTAPSSAMMKTLQTQADKSTTDIATLNSNLTPTVLCNSSQTTSFTLSDNASNYKYLEIQFKMNLWETALSKTIRVYPEQYTGFYLDGVMVSTSMVDSQLYRRKCSISGTSFTYLSDGSYISLSGVSGTNVNICYVSKITGYKIN